MPPSGFVFTGQSGCLLPILIMLNLFFGKDIFNSTRLWLTVEAVLVLLFIIKIHVFTRKISEQFRSVGGNNRNYNSQDRVVDIQGQVVEEEKKLK